MLRLVVLVTAYFLGSIPFGFLIVRLKEGADVRTSGSGGTGATNVSRRAGKAAGITTLILDALKGTAAVALALIATSSYGRNDWVVIVALVSVLVGHIFPVWLGFRGGKGVATAVGALALISPIALVCAGLVFIAIVIPTRYVSLGSIAAAMTLPVFAMVERSYFSRGIALEPLLAGVVTSSALVIFAHRANIRRLISGTESKFR
jgi:glycerol-3-phosphate acyltransferase PlsY